MSRKLTAQQVKHLASFHKTASSRQPATSGATVRFVTSEEAARLWPGIVTQYTVRVKRPPTEGRSRK